MFKGREAEGGIRTMGRILLILTTVSKELALDAWLERQEFLSVTAASMRCKKHPRGQDGERGMTSSPSQTTLLSFIFFFVCKKETIS